MQIMMNRGLDRKTVLLRRFAIGFAILALIGAGFAYKPALNRYKAWKQQRALAQAKGFLEQKDFNRTKLALDVALLAKPGNPDAIRVAADLLEQVGSPDVIRLRRSLAEALPDSASDQAALVISALRFNDLNTARDALRNMGPAQANSLEGLKAALSFAQVTNNKPVADVLYAQIREVEPDNQNLQVLHAVLRLKNPTPEIAAAARRELDKLAEDPTNHLFIQRELLVDAMRRRDFTEATRLAKELRSDPKALLSDHLHGANLALNVAHQPFDAVFQELVPHVQPNPDDTTELVRWMILVGQAPAAQTWLESQSDALQSDPAVKAVHAELAAAQNNWDQLADLLEQNAWGPVRRDTVRLAFATQLAASRNNATLQRETWSEALLSAGVSLSDLTVLYRLSVTWGWKEPTDAVLWAITKSHPAQTWAHQTLFNVFQGRKDTESMLELIDTLRQLDVSQPRYRYDWALLTMLLNNRSTWSPEKQTMHTLYESDPSNPNYITGYAFALAVAQRTEESLAVADHLGPLDRELPERAPYLAYIYAQALKSHEVQTYVALRDKIPDPLPEELALLDKAAQLVR